MASIGDNPSEAVRQTGGQTEATRGAMQRMRQDPESEIGIPMAELLRRQREAQESLKVTVGSGKVMDIKSSARAQQIMQKGAVKYQREKRRRELLEKMDIVKKARWVIGAFGFLFVGYLAQQYLLPQYFRIQDRSRTMELRRLRAEAKMQEYLAEREAAAQRQSASK